LNIQYVISLVNIKIFWLINM